MARPQWTPGTARDYLRTNHNWLRIQMDQTQPADVNNLSDKVVVRYARNFWRANEREGREFDTLAEARGHGAGEHHAGRKQKRARGYIAPSKWPRGRFNQPIAESPNSHGAFRPKGKAPGVHAGYVRITSGEGMARRELVYAAQRKQTVYIEVIGPQGKYKALFSRSGYRADLLLQAAGYKQKGSRWVKARPDASLEDYLLSIIPYTQSKSGGSDVEGWNYIALYRIIVDEEATPMNQRRKRDAWPTHDPRFRAGVDVQSLPTKSIRAKRNANRRAAETAKKNKAKTSNVSGRRTATKKR